MSPGNARLDEFWWGSYLVPRKRSTIIEIIGELDCVILNALFHDYFEYYHNVMILFERVPPGFSSINFST